MVVVLAAAVDVPITRTKPCGLLRRIDSSSDLAPARGSRRLSSRRGRAHSSSVTSPCRKLLAELRAQPGATLTPRSGLNQRILEVIQRRLVDFLLVTIPGMRSVKSSVRSGELSWPTSRPRRARGGPEPALLLDRSYPSLFPAHLAL